MNNITAYTIYISAATFITLMVGRDLHTNGYYLILDLFGNELFTKTINNLLLTGYYLINLGYMALAVSRFEPIDSLEVLFTELATKLGAILLILGTLHFNNIIILHLLSKKKQQIIQLFNT